jgi:hypothetical protein
MRANSPDQHREIIARAININPEARIIEARLAEPATLLAKRGYVNLQSLPDGRYQVEVTSPGKGVGTSAGGAGIRRLGPVHDQLSRYGGRAFDLRQRHVTPYDLGSWVCPLRS